MVRHIQQNNAKDLEVTLDSKLNCNHHIEEKATRIFGTDEEHWEINGVY